MYVYYNSLVRDVNYIKNEILPTPFLLYSLAAPTIKM